MSLRKSVICCLVGLMVLSGQALGWGPDGHHTVGAIAERLIVGSNAATQVKMILGDISLQDASVWADCAKGVVPESNYEYRPTHQYPECKVFETPALEAEMIEFVRRNDTNCPRKPDEDSCHKQYHYADVSIAHDRYDPHFVGARNDDVVGAIAAAMRVLKGDPTPEPFNLKNKKEALLVLTHYVADLHQPLHVGASYLDSNGKLVNPDKGFDRRTDTHGGNWIFVNGNPKRNLHQMWDDIPDNLKVSYVDTVLLDKAKAIPATSGQVFDWPKIWASETLMAAKQAFADIKFSSQQNHHWAATLPAGYGSKMNRIKEKQIVEAGARLAQVLQACWP